nr:hypothetical protein [Xanthomonas arboricola]
MFQHHVILDDGHRLRSAKVEIDIAQATDIEARKDAPGGGLGIEARHAAGQRQQRVVAAGGELAHRRALHHAHRHRYFLQILLAVFGSDGDRIQRGRAALALALARRRLLRRGSGGQRGKQQAGAGTRQRRALQGGATACGCVHGGGRQGRGDRRVQQHAR